MLYIYVNKLYEFMLFCFHLLYNIVNINFLSIIICVVTSISAIEEIMMCIFSKELKGDTMQVFIIKHVSYDTKQ